MISLSVIIPVYKFARYIEGCVSSLLESTAFCDDAVGFELILVDDGSTDGSSKLCDRLAADPSSAGCGIKVIHQKNSGVSAARNAGLREASGDYVLFVDSDDTLDPRELAKLLKALDNSVDMAVFGMEFDYYAGERIYRRDIMLPSAEGVKSFDECRAMLYTLFKDNVVSSLCNKLIRRCAVEKAGAFLREDMFLYEDLEFSLRVMAKCESFCFVREPIYRYRQAADEGNAGRRLKRIAHITDVVDNIEAALEPFGGSDDILLSLYLVLAREKISCASREETDTVCGDFRAWIDAHGLLEKLRGREYGMLLYEKRSAKLLAKRRVSAARHKLAVAVKKTFGDFRKR